MQNTTNNVIVRQAQLLESFSCVAHVLRGMVAFMWLPGPRQKFKGPRAVRGTRPLCVSLEVTDSAGLTLAGAIARPKQGQLRFQSIFRYEFTHPMVDGVSVGNVLSAKNEVIANRALSLLTALVKFGDRRAYQPKAVQLSAPRWPVFLVPFNLGEQQYDESKLSELAGEIAPELVETYREKLRQEMTDTTTLPGTALVNSAIVPDEYVTQALTRELGYEDYAPVLGAPHRNPAHTLREQNNPAVPLLAKHGVVNLDAVTHAQLEELVADFRSSVKLGECFTDDEVYDALVHTEAAAYCASLVNAAPDRLIPAMRWAAGASKAAREASDADLLDAAYSAGPLRVSGLSVTQICPVTALQSLPAPYVGSVLAPFDWEPRRFERAVHAQ